MAELIATISAGIWAGVSLYIAFVEHPSILRLGAEVATNYFRIMAKRTAPLMILLAAIGGVAAIFSWYEGSDQLWLIGGILLLIQFPLTAVFIVPTNIKLVKIDLNHSAKEALNLHKHWGQMHLIRTFLGCMPFLIFVWLLV
ncbi:MAG: DUF1772 domain-containing protein [Pseudomonadota bacterium]|nr:DUF1772 domain-containing protein [Pseudomonadota bacterium]